MKIETVIKLSEFQPRPYQMPIINALDKGVRRIIAILPRRAGKDLLMWNQMFRIAMKKPGVYFYCTPSFRQCRSTIWDSMTNDGKRFIDYIPKEFIANINQQEMKIKLVNGSLIQLVGSDNYDSSLVGTNVRFIVFSEWALADERAYAYVRPILSANDGTAVFITTPRGKNHAYSMFEMAKDNPEWFAYLQTVTDTGHIPLSEIEKERESGELSDDMIEQEYYCSFTAGLEGAFYTKYIDKLYLKGQIGDQPWDPSKPVYTSWDIGIRDSTSIIFFQLTNATIRIIDFYEKNKEGLEHYIHYLFSKPYIYSKHIAPHDIEVTEFSTGMTRKEKARQLGIYFTVAPKLSIIDGIEAVRSTLPKCYIDEKNCAGLIKALENYRQEYDSKRKVYKPTPLHNNFSHASDSMRYLCVSINKLGGRNRTPEELEQDYKEATFGTGQENLPSVFRTDLPRY